MGVKKAVKRGVADVKDTASEMKHRAKAGYERGKREAAGPDMRASSKVASVTKEAGHKVMAGASRAKRRIRHSV